MSKKDNIFTDEEIEALKLLARREIEKKEQHKSGNFRDDVFDCKTK